jgi:hypothetical protein
MNTVTIPSIIVDAMEAALRSAVPDDVPDSDFLAVDWPAEAEYLAQCLVSGEAHFTNPDLCRALGHNTAESVLADCRKEDQALSEMLDSIHGGS